MEEDYKDTARALALIAQMFQPLHSLGRTTTLWSSTASLFGPYIEDEETLPLRQRPWFGRMLAWIWSRSRLIARRYDTPDVQVLYDSLAAPHRAYLHQQMTASEYQTWLAVALPYLILDDVWWPKPQTPPTFFALDRVKRASADLEDVVREYEQSLTPVPIISPASIRSALAAYDELWSPELYRSLLVRR